MLKVGIVGIGGICTMHHIPAWENFEDTELVALCDIRPEQMAKFADKHRYTDFDEMLEKEKLDILDICLPTDLHADFAVKALEKGINVVCEKPISLKKSDVGRVYDTAKKHNVAFMVAHVLRFWKEYEYVKELIDSKKYGKLLTGNMQRLSTRPLWSFENWMADEKRSGLVPYDLHVHDLDFLVYALGKPDEVKSFRSKAENQDVIEVIYNFGGAYISAEAAWYAAKTPFFANFRFQFEKAVVILRDGKLNVYTEEGLALSTEDNNMEASEINVPRTSAYEKELRYFTDCVKSGVFPEKVKREELETVIDILNTL